MKKVKYILFTFLILSLSILSAYAECTKEELNTLKQEANKIKVTYKHLGGIETPIGTDYNRFEITVKNISDDLIPTLLGYEIILEPQNGVAKYELSTGNWSIDIYSNKCTGIIHSISFRLPSFNKYSLDPLCEGIDGNDFILCGKYLDYQVSYDTFKRKVEEYRKTHEIKKDNSINNEDDTTVNEILNKIVKYITDYQMHIIIVLGIILIILIILIIIKKKKKRGVLE